MSTQNQPAAQVAQKIEWQEEQFPSVYANVAAIGITPFDISILCGEVASASPSAVLAKPLVKIVLSPEQASLVMQMLQQALKKFCEASGQLRSVGGQTPNFRFENK